MQDCNENKNKKKQKMKKNGSFKPEKGAERINLDPGLNCSVSIYDTFQASMYVFFPRPSDANFF